MDRNIYWGVAGLSVWVLIIAFCNLESAPPFWWDEGWTLAAARNWIERGHYGPFLEGQPAARGMEGAFTYTVPISMAFRFFGAGVYQGRLVEVVFTLSTLVLIGYIACQFYGPKVAVASVGVLTLTPIYPGLHPVVLGRQVLGEAPAFFYLMFGYVSLLAFLPRRKAVAVTFAVLFWSLAIITKTQVLSFWAVSIIAPLSLTLVYRQWKFAWVLTVTLVFSILASELILQVWNYWIESQTVPRQSTMGMYHAVAMATSLPARLFALIVLVLFGIPSFLGLCYGVWTFIKTKRSVLDETDIVKLSLLSLATSWLAWYLLLSVGWIRYLFPASLLASIFLAKLLSDLTNNFDFVFTVRQASHVFSRFRFARVNLGALLAVLIIGTSVPRSFYMLYETYFVEADNSVKNAAQFLNRETPRDALIETYDSELFFLLDRRYHFPKDQVSVDLIRRTFLYEQDRHIDYDPLNANPDYLVVGPHSKQWRLYDEVLKTGAFRLLRSYPRYLIYERVR